jgi:hypothetical protein
VYVAIVLCKIAKPNASLAILFFMSSYNCVHDDMPTFLLAKLIGLDV